MAVTRLIERRVEKIWGRRDLPLTFGTVANEDEPVGEIWFEHPDAADLPLLVKYLFTSEKLSIQVHPDDATAREAGYRSGKDEAWLILQAEPGATIGLGLNERVGKNRLRAAVLDGSVEQMLDWRQVAAGDFFYSPAGTVHAIGPGVALIEIQQNVDLTYRLYDYGRSRELHLEEGIAAADPGPYRAPMRPALASDDLELLAEGRAFVVERRRGKSQNILDCGEDPAWLIMVAGGGTADDRKIEPGSVWLADGEVDLRLDEGSELLIAYPGPNRRQSRP